jgi:hypothetical protein
MSEQPLDPSLATFEHLVLSEEEALAVWSRAAQLHGEADDAIEREALTNDAPPVTAPVAIADGTRAPAGMYVIRDIIAAARDAGIAERHIRVALAEHDALGRELALAVDAMDDGVRERLIGVAARSVQVSRRLPESAATVLERLRRTAGTAPWSLTFDSLIGGPPTQGGVLRFTVPVIGRRPDEQSAPRALNRFIYHASRVGLLELHVTVTPLGPDAQSACDVTITGDLRPGERRSIGIYRALMKGLAGVAAVAGAIVGAKAGGPVVAAAGAGLGVALAVGYNQIVSAIGRGEHRLAHRVLTAELDELLRALQRPSDEVRAFGAAAPAPHPRLVPRRDADVDGLQAIRASVVAALVAPSGSGWGWTAMRRSPG